MPSDATRRRSPLGRSLDIYYRDAARTARMDRLNSLFVPRGGLAFDIGAHLGDRTGSFRRLGARAVALEPQPRVFRALRLLQGRAENVVLLPRAVGARAGEVTLHLNARNPTVATLAPDFIAAAREAEGWRGEVWDGRITVPVTTLDTLIARHGTPDFIKIDVEGHEAAVLRGLSVPVRAVSFEFTTLQKNVAQECLERLAALGRYRFNLSLGEDHALRLRSWTDAEGMSRILEELPVEANSGDVYARLG